MADKVEHVLDDGITYELKLAANPTPNNGGYMGVVQQGNLYYAKITLEKGAGQMVIPGGGCSIPREAASTDCQVLGQPIPHPQEGPGARTKRCSKGAPPRLPPALNTTDALCVALAEKAPTGRGRPERKGRAGTSKLGDLHAARGHVAPWRAAAPGGAAEQGDPPRDQAPQGLGRPPTS